MKRSFFILFMIIFVCDVLSQTHKDSSYNTLSEYNKQLKKFPFIKVAKPTKDSLVTETNDIIYCKNEKQTLKLDAYIYKSNIKLPALLLIHGGGWFSGDKIMLKPLAYTMSKKGYNCFSIEYRLSDEAKYPASINDVLEALKFIKANAEVFNVDTLKIAVLGCSSGAQMASLVGTKYPEKFQAIINLDGILAFHHPESKEGQMASKWLGATYEENPHIWNEASALSHVTKNTPPILFINSQYDRFHAGRDDMIKMLNNYTIYSKIEKIKDSPHTFWLFEPWFDDTVSYITSFLDQQFKLN